MNSITRLPMPSNTASSLRVSQYSQMLAGCCVGPAALFINKITTTRHLKHTYQGLHFPECVASRSLAQFPASEIQTEDEYEIQDVPTKQIIKCKINCVFDERRHFSAYRATVT